MLNKKIGRISTVIPVRLKRSFFTRTIQVLIIALNKLNTMSSDQQ